MKTKLSLLCLSLVLAVAGLAACDKASPVAPAGTVLSVTANPTQIPATGASQVRVVALRANGTPVNPGTQIRMSTSLGTIDPLVEVGEGGVAIGTLQGDGRIGTATVTASVGAETTATVEVAVGRPAANISLQTTPSQVSPETGGTVQLLAVVRDATGEPLADAAVNFQTEVGVLSSRGAILRTNSNGQVSDTLRVEPTDLTATISNFTVSAFVGAGESTTSDNRTIQVIGCSPQVSFTVTATSNLRAQVSDTVLSGERPITIEWDQDQDTQFEPEAEGQLAPVFTYPSAGTYTVVARVTNECGQNTEPRQVRVCNDPPCSSATP